MHKLQQTPVYDYRLQDMNTTKPSDNLIKPSYYSGTSQLHDAIFK